MVKVTGEQLVLVGRCRLSNGLAVMQPIKSELCAIKHLQKERMHRDDAVKREPVKLQRKYDFNVTFLFM